MSWSETLWFLFLQTALPCLLRFDIVQQLILAWLVTATLLSINRINCQMANRNILGIAILGGLAAHAVAAYFIVKLAISLIGTAIGADGQNVFYKMLFFPDDKVACRANFTKRHGCTNSTCQFSHDTDLSYAQLMKQVSSARKTIDLCVFTITCRDLSEIVIDLFNKGVAVRVITDDEQVDATGSQIGEFRAAGNYWPESETSV